MSIRAACARHAVAPSGLDPLALVVTGAVDLGEDIVYRKMVEKRRALLRVVSCTGGKLTDKAHGIGGPDLTGKHMQRLVGDIG